MKSIHFKKKKSVIENRTWELYFLGQITSINNGQFRANILMKFRANMGIVKCADMPENLKKWHCPSSPVELGKHPWTKLKLWILSLIHKFHVIYGDISEFSMLLRVYFHIFLRINGHLSYFNPWVATHVYFI